MQFILLFNLFLFLFVCLMLALKKKKKQQINLKPLATTQPAKTSTSKAKTQPTPLPKQPAPATFGGSNKKPMSLAAGLVPAAPPKRPAATTARPSTLPSKDAKPKVSGHLSTMPGKSSPLWVSNRSHCSQTVESSCWNWGKRGKATWKSFGAHDAAITWKAFRPCTFPCPCLQATLHLLGGVGGGSFLPTPPYSSCIWTLISQFVPLHTLSHIPFWYNSLIKFLKFSSCLSL